MLRWSATPSRGMLAIAAVALVIISCSLTAVVMLTVRPPCGSSLHHSRATFLVSATLPDNTHNADRHANALPVSPPPANTHPGKFSSILPLSAYPRPTASPQPSPVLAAPLNLATGVAPRAPPGSTAAVCRHYRFHGAGEWVSAFSLRQLLADHLLAAQAVLTAPLFNLACIAHEPAWSTASPDLQRRLEVRLVQPHGVWMRAPSAVPTVPSARVDGSSVLPRPAECRQNRTDSECAHLARYQIDAVDMLTQCGGRTVGFVGDSFIRELFDELTQSLVAIDWRARCRVVVRRNEATTSVTVAKSAVHCARKSLGLRDEVMGGDTALRQFRDNFLALAKMSATTSTVDVDPRYPLPSIIQRDGICWQHKCTLNPALVRSRLPKTLVLTAYAHFTHNETLRAPNERGVFVKMKSLAVFREVMMSIVTVLHHARFDGELIVILPFPRHTQVVSKDDLDALFEWPSDDVQRRMLKKGVEKHSVLQAFTDVMVDVFTREYPRARLVDLQCASIVRPDGHSYRQTLSHGLGWDLSHYCTSSVASAWAQTIMGLVCRDAK
jgi:hypothetical protein